MLDFGPPSPLRSEDSPTAKLFKEWCARQAKSFVGFSACASDTVVISESEDDEQDCDELGEVEDEQDCPELSEVADEQNCSELDEIQSASDAPELKESQSPAVPADMDEDPLERVLARNMNTTISLWTLTLALMMPMTLAHGGQQLPEVTKWGQRPRHQKPFMSARPMGRTFRGDTQAFL